MRRLIENNTNNSDVLRSAMFALMLAFVFVLTSCGGGEGDSAVPEADSETVAPQQSSITGAAVKGPLAHADVRVYAIDLSVQGFKGALITQGTTDSKTEITGVSVNADAAPFLIEVTSNTGTVDITTNKTPVITNLQSILTKEQIESGASIYVTPLTSIATGVALARLDVSDDISQLNDALAFSSKQITTVFGFGFDGNIFTTPPLLKTESNNSTAIPSAEYRYAIEVVTGIVQKMNSNSGQAVVAHEILAALVEDLSDGILDGKSLTGDIDKLKNADIESAIADITGITIPGSDNGKGEELSATQVVELLVDEQSITGITSNVTEPITITSTAEVVVLPDTDGDGVSDAQEIIDGSDPLDAEDFLDTDGDGIADVNDIDIDNDGFINPVDMFPLDPTEHSDLDDDGIGDNSDSDRDGDGYSNYIEETQGSDPDDATSVPPALTDTDGDGIPDVNDIDMDNDGFINPVDVFPLDPTEHSDLDNDGIGDNSDTDRDGDGFSNETELAAGSDPNDANSIPLELTDTDGDGIPDINDIDMDNDGFINPVDKFPLDPTEHSDLDNDGIGDNSDPDRDGDGVSNVDELAAGSDPDDPLDFPDTTPPQIQANLTDGLETIDFSIEISGQVTDDLSGVGSVLLTNDQLPNQPFGTVLTFTDSNLASYQGSIPLVVGQNVITIEALDNKGNASQLQRTVTVLQTTASLTITEPTPLQSTFNETLTVTGNATIPATAQAIVLNIQNEVTELTSSGNNTYQFQKEQTLIVGVNEITVTINYDLDGQVNTLEQTVTVIRNTHDQTTADKPTIEILSPLNGSFINEQSFLLAGSFVSEAGLQSLTVNGAAIDLLSLTGTEFPSSGNFSEIINTSVSEGELLLAVVAVDVLGQSIQYDLSYQVDFVAPVITVDQPYLLSPEVNQVFEQHTLISGTVSDSNLSGFTINGQAVSLVPLDSQTFKFEININLPLNQEEEVTFNASDASGNQSSNSYILKLSGTTGISFISPQNDSDFITGENSDTAIPVVIKLTGIFDNLNIKAHAVLSDGQITTPVLLNQAGDIASGELLLSTGLGSYKLIVQAVNTANNVVAQTSTNINIIDQVVTPLELVGISPANGFNDAEPDQFITVGFNQPINSDEFDVKVYETFSGKTYINNDPPGVDAIFAKGFTLEEVTRVNELVPGGISVLPGDSKFIYYLKRRLAYGADIRVDVYRNGEKIKRSTFKVKQLPTLVSGAVVDQLGASVSGITVEMPELDIKTTTDKLGQYHFGYDSDDLLDVSSGKYTIHINKAYSYKDHADSAMVVDIQEGIINSIRPIKVASIDGVDINNYQRGQASLHLNQSTVVIDMTNADLLFEDGSFSGRIYSFFQPSLYATHAISGEYGMLEWFYSFYPERIKVVGTVSIRIQMPVFDGGYDYLPQNNSLMLIYGLSEKSNQVRPVALGRLNNNIVQTLGNINLDYLSELSVISIPEGKQEALQSINYEAASIEEILGVLR